MSANNPRINEELIYRRSIAGICQRKRGLSSRHYGYNDKALKPHTEPLKKNLEIKATAGGAGEDLRLFT